MKNLFTLFAIAISFSALTAGNLLAGSCGGCGDSGSKDKTEEKGGQS
jgi:hypothetical protein